MTNERTANPTNGVTDTHTTQHNALGHTQPKKKASAYQPKPGVSPEVREAKRRANQRSLEARAKNKAQEAETGKSVKESRRQKTQELEHLVTELREHAAAALDWDDREEFLYWGQRILNAAIWRKKSNENLDVTSPLMEEEQELPFEQQQYAGFYIPEAAATMAGLSHEVRLTEPLVDFMVKVFQVAKKDFFLVPGASNKEVRYVLQELQQRESGVDTFEPSPEPPKQKVDGVNMSEWPKDFQKLVLNSNTKPLNFDDTRLFLVLALAQPDLPEYLRKRFETAFNPSPKKETIYSAPDPLVAIEQRQNLEREEQIQQQEDERLRTLSPDAWAYLRGNK